MLCDLTRLLYPKISDHIRLIKVEIEKNIHSHTRLHQNQGPFTTNEMIYGHCDNQEASQIEKINKLEDFGF